MPGDRVLVACDLGKSWRKQVDSSYKANRKANREAHEEIDWKKSFGELNELKLSLNDATPWEFCEADTVEADDWMAEGVRYFTEYDHVIISHDADLEQLFIYPNVNIFSPASKPPRYKMRPVNPYVLLMQKIRMEKSDNLTEKLVSERDEDKRQLIVSLLELPSWVTVVTNQRFATLREPGYEKLYDESLFPYSSLLDRYKNLGSSNKLITYEQSRKIEARRAKKKRKKVA